MPRCGKYTSYEFTFVFPFRSQKTASKLPWRSMGQSMAVLSGTERFFSPTAVLSVSLRTLPALSQYLQELLLRDDRDAELLGLFILSGLRRAVVIHKIGGLL